MAFTGLPIRVSRKYVPRLYPCPSMRDTMCWHFQQSPTWPFKSTSAIGLPIYNFWHVQQRYLSKLSHTHPYPVVIFFKIQWFPPWVRGKASTNNEAARFNIFWDILNTDRRTDTQMQSKKPRRANQGRGLIIWSETGVSNTLGVLLRWFCHWFNVLADVSKMTFSKRYSPPPHLLAYSSKTSVPRGTLWWSIKLLN